MTGTTATPTAPVHTRQSTSLAVLAFAAAIALLYFGRVLIITLVIAGILAFILDPLVTLIMKLRLPRAVASFIVCTTAVLGIYLSGVGLYTQVAGLVEELPTYSEHVNQLVDAVATRVDQIEKRTYALLLPKRMQTRPPDTIPPTPRSAGRKRPADPLQPPPVQVVRVQPEPTPLFSIVYGYLVSFYEVLLMASFVPFLVYFMLSWRDHIRRSFFYLFSGSERQIAGKSWERIGEMTRAYVIGNFILGLFIAVLSSVVFFLIRLPYWPIMGPLSGFLSLVPYVGLPLALAPPLLAGVAVYTQPGSYVIIGACVGFLHLFAMNVLYPKVVGSRVHLNPLVVTIALMFWGTLWGGIGLLLAIPMTAGIKAVCDNIGSLQGYGKLLGD